MNIGEIGFVIRKEDGTYILQQGGRRSRRRGKPWTTWAAADKYNRNYARVFVEGRWTERYGPALGEIITCKLCVVG